MANNILPFCPTDTGTNLLTQSQYAAASDRTNGNQPGIASSKLNNKAIRQATFMTSQLAQFMADKLNVNILDNGDTAALLAQVNSTFVPNESYQVENLTLTFSVAASAATVAVKTLLGVDPSATDIVYAGVRSATLTSGVYNRRSIIAGLSTTIPNLSTLGQTSAQPSMIWVYLLDNAGVLEMALSHSRYPENQLMTTTAWSAGNANSATTVYSTVARASVPCRLVGQILNTQTTAGTWAQAATKIQLLPSEISARATLQTLAAGSGTYNTPAGCTRMDVIAVGPGGGGGGAVTGAANTGSSGGGGGGGGSCRLLIVNPLSSYAYVVGAGGAGGAAGNNSGASGSAATTFAGMSAGLATGGGGSGAGTGPIFGSTGGTGGSASGGSLNFVGGAGGGGLILAASQVARGSGGGTFLSVSNQNLLPVGTGAGTAGNPYGGGGSGGVQAQGGASQAGGAGAEGVIFVLEYYD